MNRARLRKRFLKSRAIEDKLAYNWQSNSSLSLIRKVQRDYYSNLNNQKVEFIKSHFSNKSSALSKLILIENDLIVSKDEDTLFVMNDFFKNLVSSMDIPQIGLLM